MDQPILELLTTVKCYVISTKRGIAPLDASAAGGNMLVIRSESDW